MRQGNAGSNAANDDITVFKAAVSQLPVIGPEPGSDQKVSVRPSGSRDGFQPFSRG